MRKPRDIDAELKTLQDRQRQLRTRRTAQLGELVAATGAAEALKPEALAGLLLDAVERARTDPEIAAAWEGRGAAFFRRERRSRSRKPDGSGDAPDASGGSAAGADGERGPDASGPARAAAE